MLSMQRMCKGNILYATFESCIETFVALTFLIQNNIVRTLGPKLSLFKVFLPISLDTKCHIGLKDSRFIETPMSLKPLQMG